LALDQPKSAADWWSRLNGLSDEQLAESLVGGDQDALTVLFDRYHKLIFSVAVRIVNDAGEAEDIVQTVFLDFFKSVANFDPQKGILKVWLLQYAYHRALNRKRHLAASRFYKWVNFDDAAAEPLLSWNPGEVAEIARLMEQLMSSLSPRKRLILELTYFEGLTAEEIAVKVNETVNVVRHDLYRALAKLRKVILERNPRGAADRAVSMTRGALKANA
jgi:RNA polymerase sigma-70 factor, ECF subfamily